MIEDPRNLILLFVVIGVLFMFFGMIVGVAISNLRRPKFTTNEPGGKAVHRPGLVELARFWREPASGKLIVEVGEQLYRAHADLNPSQKDRLLQLLMDFGEWLRLGISEGGKSGSSLAESATAPDQTVDLDAVAIEMRGEIAPPSMNMVDIFSQAITGLPPKKVVAPVSNTIAGQIDAILQIKLENSPLRSRGIRLVDLPVGGIQVVVGLERFESVADVTDSEIKALLQACVAEWEKKNYPK